MKRKSSSRTSSPRSARKAPPRRAAAGRPSPFLRIGDLAREVGLTNQMVHFYCSMGLLREARKTRSGYRLFGPEAVRRIRLIRELNRHGYSLREIKQTFRRAFDGDGSLA